VHLAIVFERIVRGLGLLGVPNPKDELVRLRLLEKLLDNFKALLKRSDAHLLFLVALANSPSRMKHRWLSLSLRCWSFWEHVQVSAR
jgi:hypothetical protein